jgi:energy-coupling factor transporter ATP-binding protein EcfA2
MRLLNPRLLRQAGPARGYLAVTVALGLAGAVLILFQADLLSRALAGAARGTGIAALSGGQRQRLAVARALLADPDLLILDEPTTHLDPGTRRALLSDVLAATAGRTMLLITHDLDGLDEFDQVITLEGGTIADVYLLRDPGSGSSATRYPSRLRGAQCIPAGGPDRAARFT